MQSYISSFDELKRYLSIRYVEQATSANGLPACSATVSKKLDPATLLSPEESSGIRGFPLRIPYYYADLIDWKNPHDPLRLMAMPREIEKNVAAYELADPIGDQDREVVPGLIHRYPDRCLLLLTSHCKIHCRFCFRREVVGKVRPVQFAAIREYLTMHKEIHEVIFSGGDPGTFPPAFLDNIRRQLSDIRHIQCWRFHTRIPVADPSCITDEWLAVLDRFRGKKVVVIHTNHPAELTSQVRCLVNKMLQKNILVVSQTVLLKNVNDDVPTLKIFFRQLVDFGIKPYYLHHLDQARGTSHFRISIAEGKNIFKALRGSLSSICMPEYVLDLPRGMGKIPVMWLEKITNTQYRAQTFEGITVTYTDQAIP
jgi:lysine 2,3-aminomutase